MTEARSLRLGIRAALDGGDHVLTLQPMTPNVVDDYGTVWAPHSLDKGLEARMPTLAWGHNWAEPIGQPMSFTTSDAGPTVTFQLDDFDAVPRAAQAWAQVRSGTIEDCSIGFSRVPGGTLPPTDAQRRQYPGIVEFIREATAEEVSLVLRGAIPGAKVLAARGREGAIGAPTGRVLGAAGSRAAGASHWNRQGTLIAEIERRRRLTRSR